jgi:alpha-L-rhamnosidase
VATTQANAFSEELMMTHRRKIIVSFSLLLVCNQAVWGTVLQSGARSSNATAEVVELRCEYKINPLGIDAKRPRLSWQIRSSGRGVVQTAYQIQVAVSETGLKSGANLTWDTGKVISAESLHRNYEGSEVRPAQRYHWRVRVWDNGDKTSAWSEPAFWETGLLEATNWKANWIEPDLQEDTSKSQPAPMLRRTFKLTNDPRSARLYVSSHGLYEIYVNGKRVGDEVFTPGWTSYNKRLQYQTFDVSDLLVRGDNSIGAFLGDGWYRGNIGFSNRRNVYGNRLALLMQLQITFRDGRQEIVVSDQNWKSSTGPILMSEIYHGETYDARLEKTGWNEAGYDDSSWAGVKVVDHPKNRLIASEGPPVKKIQEIKPVKIIKTPAGATVVDLGQNMVGWIRLKVQGLAGTTVTLVHAEVLDKQGNFYIENLRRAAQKVQYILKGGGVEVYEPRFTFQGFRYVAVDGYPGELTLDSLTGVVVHSEMKPTGEFSTSNHLINQLQQNIVWGQKGNFLDVPTDCPQRDERLGWTGDAQVFARTAAFNMDVSSFFSKWLKDLSADQYQNGSVPWVIPDVISRPEGGSAGSAGWADAAVIIPWTMYLSYGDTRVLEEQYPSMVRWVEFMKQRAGEDFIWDGDFHFGDWLAFATTRSDYPGATTGKDLIATAFFAHSTSLLSRIALILGKKDDAARYNELATNVKSAFRREFVTQSGRVGENTQTAYVLALEFDLLPDDMRASAAQRLAREVRERKHLTTGFLGTPYLCHVLSRYGYLDEAYMLLNREQYPSWLYPVKQGATTIWERWDGLKPDGTFQDKGMNSFNHYAYGAVGDWMYRVMAGIEIDPSAPGYRHILIQPRPGSGFTHAKASHLTLYGRVASSWEIKNDRFDLSVEVPPNTRATIRLPSAELAGVTEGGRPLQNGNGIVSSRQDATTVVLEVGSGEYKFGYAIKR